jgi:endonuclease/exonuclease/phosphatase family metal-dependent hydrolase
LGYNNNLVISRLPFREVEALRPPAEALQSRANFPLRVLVSLGGRDVAIYTAHPDTPRSPGRWRSRNLQLAWLGARLAAEDGGRPRLLMGDLNTPPASPWFTALLREGGVADAAGGGLRRPTRQPSRHIPLLSLLGAPVDHVLVSPELGVARFAIGPQVGSDHLPVIADLRLLPDQSSAANPSR